jgi:hypothetical protein
MVDEHDPKVLPSCLKGDQGHDALKVKPESHRIVDHKERVCPVARGQDREVNVVIVRIGEEILPETNIHSESKRDGVVHAEPAVFHPLVNKDRSDYKLNFNNLKKKKKKKKINQSAQYL